MNAKLGSGMRIAPFGLLVYGVAGTFKTNLVRKLAEVLAVDNGLDTSADGTYNHRPGNNFQDGLTHRQWHIALDDID